MKTACPHRIRTPCARRSPGKKGAFFPGTLARPRPATEAPQRKGKASLALRRASRALALRPLSAAGRTRDAWLREKGFWPSFSPKGGRERSVLASVQRTVPTQGRACLPRPMPAERLKKVSVFLSCQVSHFSAHNGRMYLSCQIRRSGKATPKLRQTVRPEQRYKRRRCRPSAHRGV